jgi:hypothetical protein
VQELKGNVQTLQAKGQGGVNAELRNGLSRELSAVKQTAAKFRSLGGNAEVQESARILFFDLSATYLKTAESLRPDRVSIVTHGFFAPAQVPKDDSDSYLAQEAVYRAAEPHCARRLRRSRCGFPRAGGAHPGGKARADGDGPVGKRLALASMQGCWRL